QDRVVLLQPAGGGAWPTCERCSEGLDALVRLLHLVSVGGTLLETAMYLLSLRSNGSLLRFRRAVDDAQHTCDADGTGQSCDRNCGNEPAPRQVELEAATRRRLERAHSRP